MRPIWTIDPEWRGERCFIVGGGPSAASAPIERLRGRKVIAINSSYDLVPFADILFFADARWWRLHRDRPGFREFAGRMVTISPHVADRKVEHLYRSNPPGLAYGCNRVVMRKTGVAAAVNIAVHLGVASIVLIGVDAAPAPDGTTHHHEPHPWTQPQNCFAEQIEDLSSLVTPLAERKIDVINASPTSAVPFWPRATLAGILDTEAYRW